MAYQTPYSDAYINTRAIANYNNPMFDVLRRGLGWLEDQGQQIADRKKAELLKQIQNEDMINRYIQAKNANEDLAKQLYGNSYFVNSSDADLDKAMEALKIKESNKMLDTVGRDIVSKVNQDVYKAGNEQELLSSLGFNNRTQDELNKIKDFAQQQLKSRYEPYIQGKLANREVTEGKINEDDIDNLVSSFKERYGMDVNPALYYNSEKRKDYRKSALNSKLQQITSQLHGKQITPEQAIDQYRLLSLINSDFAEGINSQAQVAQKYADEQYEQEVANMLSAAREDFRDELGNVNDRALLRAVWDKGLSMNIPASIMRKVINSMYPQQAVDEASFRARRNLAVAEQEKKDFDTENGYIFGEPDPILAKAMSEGDFYKKASDTFLGLILTPDFSSFGLSESDLNSFLNFIYRKHPEIIGMEENKLKDYFKNNLKGYVEKKARKNQVYNNVLDKRIAADATDNYHLNF